MAEYIEREALIGILNAKADVALGTPKEVFYSVSRMVELLPTADVVEVRHGRWQWDVETHGDLMYGVDEDYGYRCSECQVWADEYGVDGDIYEEPPTHILHYCPNCGAKMDGKGEGE